MSMEPTAVTKDKVVIFYDGACYVCAAEINHYRNIDKADAFRLIDISEKNFAAEEYGLDRRKVQEVMHVLDRNGKLQTGVDAFITIWEELPKYRFLAVLARKSFVRRVLDVGYVSFTKIRPYLPRKQTPDCSTDVCFRPGENASELNGRKEGEVT